MTNNPPPQTDSPQPSRPLNGRVAVVTGSSSGIGKAIALELGAAGAKVLVHSRSRSGKVQEVVAEIIAQGGEAYAIGANLEEEQGRLALASGAWNWQGHVDIWINNAGADVLTGEHAAWSFEKKLELLWQVDVLSTLQLSRWIGAKMKQRGSGSIINIGWDQAAQGMAGDSGEMFATSKGAIMAFTRSLAQSLAPQVRVNCLAPGWIRTAWGEQASDAWQNRALEESLLNRWGKPARR